ncbi:hypothetical protein GIB67_041637 [Kingdonia uniflora]|uniref:DUF4283 domain-containing protein n=1 Tax=Kingdonia uniflora TaxID=39325 RepID=A0A7J7MQM5_9MAGN|nr:hypothetical protein GIB67_041637 [Kingdonia uniflora]
MDLWESESLFPNPNRNGAGEKHPQTGSYAEITKQQMGSSCSIEQLPIPGRRGNSPSIKIPIEAHKRGLDRNKFNLVGRLDLTKIKIAEVCLIAFALWKPKGVCRIVLVGKGYFTIFLDNEEDRNNIWRGGPWMIDKQLLRLSPWSPCFDSETQKNSHALCWVKFPGLGFEFWEVDSLMVLGRTMGTPIHVDRTHSDFEYFAKVLVDIDLAEPIPNKVLVEVEDGDFWQKVELLPKFCPHNKMVGHNLSECRGVRAQVQLVEEIKDKRNHEEAKKGTGEHNTEGTSFTKNQKKKIRKKQNKEPLVNGIGTSATTESGGKEVGDDQITTDELCHALISVVDGQNHGAASTCKEGVASKTSGNRPTGAKEGADSISQIIRETSLILLHKDENWADMVEDEERDEACVTKSASNSKNNAKKSNKKARAKGARVHHPRARSHTRI